MCHGQMKNSKTVRFKKDEGHHKNTIPYKRTDKHKSNWTDDYRQL